MSRLAHVYQIYVQATPEQVWRAITDSDWTERFFHQTRFIEPPRAGAAYTTVLPDGRKAVEGVIEVLEPPAEGRPGRLVQTWHVLYDAELAAEPPGRVEWTVETAGEGLTRVRLVHGDLFNSPLTWAAVKDGWVWVLDALKTLLETGKTLPSVARESDEGEADTARTEAQWHRGLAIDANNATWDVLAEPASPERDESALRHAYAAAYHWERAAGSGPANQARAAWLVSKVLLATGQPERALVSADACLAICAEHGLVDFDLAYAHEARARALHALGREWQPDWAAALAVPIADPEDQAIVTADFADFPPR